jgi:carbon storage regulator
MLVLSRKKNEALSIGGDILIEVLDIEGDRVRLGIRAPKEVRIFRKELLLQTIDINKSAINTPTVRFPKE